MNEGATTYNLTAELNTDGTPSSSAIANVTNIVAQNTIVGSPGAAGATGAQGPQGVPGPPGPPGSNIYFNVVSYGAVGDGVTDDTVAINSATSSAAGSQGGVIYFPEGVYVISGAVNLGEGTSILGDGVTASVIRQTSTTADALSLTGSGTVNASLSIQQVGITGPGSGSGEGISLSGAPLVYVSMRDVSVTSFGATGVHISGSIVTTLERVTSTGNGLHGFWIDGTSSFVTSTSLINCYGNNNPAAGIYIYKATYVSLTGCASDSNGIGYLLSDVFALSATGCGTESSQSHSISGYPGVGWKVIGDNTFGSGSVSLSGCFVYDVHNIAYWITGFTTGASLNACIDSTPHSGATYSLQVDSTATASSVACNFANPNNITGAYTILSDAANSYSYLRFAYASALISTDTPTAIGSSTSSLQLIASAGTNYIETVGATNAGAAPLIIGSKFIGIEYLGFDSSGNATFPNNAIFNAGVKVSTGASNGYVLTSDASGNGTWQATSGVAINRSINSISTATNAGAAAKTDYVYLVSGTTTLTLPTAVGNTNRYTVKNTGNATVTVATTSAQTIDGAATITLPVANTSVDIVSDNSNWRII